MDKVSQTSGAANSRLGVEALAAFARGLGGGTAVVLAVLLIVLAVM
ncbi:hypothetical protein [Streptomyces sp. NPDC004528]